MFRRFSTALAATLAVACLAAPALAQPACPLTYAIFEFAVPHLDLDECPAELARKDVFCRASVANDMVHVFVFPQDGDQCLVAVKSYKPDQYRLTVK